jgi:hypothetical protein
LTAQEKKILEKVAAGASVPGIKLRPEQAQLVIGSPWLGYEQEEEVD